MKQELIASKNLKNFITKLNATLSIQLEIIMDKQKYAGCWYCDNIIDHPDQAGLLYLGFPRCFVLIPSSSDFYFSTYDEFVDGVCEINWLDPSDQGTPEEQRKVLTTLWNFSIEQENEEENLYNSICDE